MANALSFKPNPVDPHLELERRLSNAPREHAEALLVVYDILQASHENGTLDAIHGLVTARDKIAGRLAEAANTEEGKTALLNLLEAGKILASLDSEVLAPLAAALHQSAQDHKAEKAPPSTWQLFRRATSDDGRRGLSFFTLLLANLGKSLKR